MLLDIKTNCFSKCIFCTRFFGSEIMGISSLKELNKKVLSCDDDIIEIGGAEPLNYIKISNLINFIKKHTNKSIKIKTSGIIQDIKEFNNQCLLLVDIIEIPIFSLDRDKLEFITGQKGAYEKYIYFLNLLYDMDLISKLKFHIVVVNENFDDLINIFYFLYKKFNIKFIYLTYPRKPDFLSDDKDYYKITVSKSKITEKYDKYIQNGIFRLVNF